MNYLQKISKNNETSSVIKLNNENIWIKNKLEDKILYINAKNINIKKMLLTDVMIVDNNRKKQKIYFAESGEIQKKHILLKKVKETDIKLNKSNKYDYKNIQINFIQQDILNSLKYYKAYPFQWAGVLLVLLNAQFPQLSFLGFDLLPPPWSKF